MDRRFQDQRLGALIAGTLECMVSIREVQSGRQTDTDIPRKGKWEGRLGACGANSRWP